ncbi:hypothetical protein [Aeromonas sp. JL9]|uniref:hypothetical protein n=1 Tax=Aeromonas sp. JL9 TaxID=2950549 RepID=UPI0021086B37|nr:hypothetical protein [Aeromonas sp. JL9]MCQ4107585.1 hypothetical protein [Aeromonas sp. JL9]
MKWWEKTVEYSFVLDAAEKGIFNLFAPLDGDVESIGDTVVCKDSTYFILEFKKSLSDLLGEYKKYVGGENGFLSAGIELKDMPAFQAHFLIGGKLDKASKTLEIQVRKYFEPSIISGGLAQVFKEGVTLNEMQDYTKKLTKFKVQGDVGDNSSGSSGGNVYQSVLAISKSKKTATLIPLHYFKNFQLTASYKNSSGPSGP